MLNNTLPDSVMNDSFLKKLFSYSSESTESTEQPTEEAPKQMTLDEWKAQQEKNRMRNQFNIRKPGEGDTATSQWKKGTAYRKKLEEENEESDDDEEYEEVM